MSAKRPGKIVTFYSYKGGTGRSMALANMAWVLASNGKRVLLVDWDLEAPGLHRFFHPFLEDKTLASSEGVIDFVVDFAAEAVTPFDGKAEDLPTDWYRPHANILRHATSLRWDKFRKPGTIDFVPAGKQGPSYATRVNGFDWRRFYERLGGHWFIEAAKDRMRAEYDYVLIDSRTGVSDTSGICTVQLPDILVVCFTLNNQSIEGAAAVAESVHEQRRLDTGEPGIRIFPIPTRVERAEKEKLDLAREAAIAKFSAYLWHVPRENQQTYWGDVEVFYEPYYAYEEILASFGDRPREPASLLASIERITTYVTGARTPTKLVSPTETERQRVLAQYARPRPIPAPVPSDSPTHSYWFYLSYARNDLSPHLEQLFLDLYREVGQRAGLALTDEIGFFDRAGIEIGDFFPVQLAHALERSRVLVALYSPAYFNSESCGKEFQFFRERQALSDPAMGSARRRPTILPVLWSRPRGPLPAAAADIQYLDVSFPPAYQERGLRSIMLLSKQDDYRQVVEVLAERIIDVAEQTALPTPHTLPPLHVLPNAFHDEHEPDPERLVTGPTVANFVFFVARREEMEQVRPSVTAYAETGWGWHPFSPGSDQSVGVIAQLVAAEANQLYREIDADHLLIQRLLEAKQHWSSVVIVIDPWTLLLPQYQTILSSLDAQDFYNVELLAVWNLEDPETMQSRSALEAALRASTRRWYMQSRMGQITATSLSSLQAELNRTLTVLRTRIIGHPA